MFRALTNQNLEKIKHSFVLSTVGTVKKSLQLLSFVLLIGSISGCLAVPVPLFGTSSDEISQIKAGITTREEVEEILGEPNILNHPRYSVYRLIGPGFGLVLIGGDQVEAIEERDDSHRVVINYDSQGQVVEEIAVEAESIYPKQVPLKETFPSAYLEFEQDVDFFLLRESSWMVQVSDSDLTVRFVSDDTVTRDLASLKPTSGSCIISTEITNPLSQETNVFMFAVVPRAGSEVFRFIKATAATTASEEYLSSPEFFNEFCSHIEYSSYSNPLSFSADDDYVVVVETESKIFQEDESKLWLWSKRDSEWISVPELGEFRSMKFTKDNKFLITVKTDDDYVETVNFWTLPGLRKIFNHSTEVTGIGLSEDESLLGICSANHVEIWEKVKDQIEPFRIKKVFPIPFPHGCGVMKFSEDNRYLLLSTTVWDTRTWQLLASFYSKEGRFNRTYLQDENTLVIALQKWRANPFKPSRAQIWKVPLDQLFEQFERRNE